ncbi:DUF4337 domain-containing protein [Fimbriiglobus ruber]|uniref:Putative TRANSMEMBRANE PROTEIN n=1 Tax=Fimbriiglobus ruber TaxID=1908690 RepID=A0A225CYX6_9BACT|nr:DUF4337 domain-containing protein [Fimbriiglobus ruber]OWK34541.1 putative TRANSMEMBRANE PROTEIN [Fimbriiglobus ruber]
MAEIEIPHPHEVKEKAEHPFLRMVALSVAFYAVGLAISSFGTHSTAKEMMLAKQEEANQWNRYQSKSTREALYRNEILKLKAEKKSGTMPQYKEELLAEYEKEESRMIADKKEIEEGGKDKDGKELHGARHYQNEVKLLQRKDPYFEFAEVIFQLAIVLASVAMLAEKKWAFYVSVGLAIVGVLLTANGFALLVAIPGIDHGTHSVAH